MTQALSAHLREMGFTLSAARDRLDSAWKLVEALNPSHVLDRGYAWVEAKTGGVLTSAAAARRAGALVLHFGDGEVAARVEGAGGKAYVRDASAKDAPDQPTLL